MDARSVYTAAYDNGFRRSLASWISGPKEVITFLPRLSTGALLAGPSLLTELNIAVNQIQTLMNDTVMSDEEKRVCMHPWQVPLLRSYSGYSSLSCPLLLTISS